MQMFFKLVRFDLRNGLAAEWKKFLTALIVFLGFFSLHYLRVTAENVYLQRTGEKGLQFTCADFILSVLGGMRRVGSGEGNMETFPALWMFFFLLLLFDTLRYPARNLEGMGKTMLLLSRSRRMWWLSKCVWCCCYVWAYFLLLYASAFLMALCLGGEMTLQPSEYAPSMLDAGRHIKAPPWNMSPGLLLAPLAACGMAMLQMALSLWMPPVFAYVFSDVLLLASVFLAVPGLVGNYAMLFRTQLFAEDGFSLGQGFFGASMLIVLSLLAGCLRVERMDILNRE